MRFTTSTHNGYRILTLAPGTPLPANVSPNIDVGASTIDRARVHQRWDRLEHGLGKNDYHRRRWRLHRQNQYLAADAAAQSARHSR